MSKTVFKFLYHRRYEGSVLAGDVDDRLPDLLPVVHQDEDKEEEQEALLPKLNPSTWLNTTKG